MKNGTSASDLNVVRMRADAKDLKTSVCWGLKLKLDHVAAVTRSLTLAAADSHFQTFHGALV
jgi:hypothetical protein